MGTLMTVSVMLGKRKLYDTVIPRSCWPRKKYKSFRKDNGRGRKGRLKKIKKGLITMTVNETVNDRMQVYKALQEWMHLISTSGKQVKKDAESVPPFRDLK